MSRSCYEGGRRIDRVRQAARPVTVIAATLAVALSTASPALTASPTPSTGPTTGGTAVTVPVPGADSFVSISGGLNHALALDAEGNIWAWGDNLDGQAGAGATVWSVTRPQQVTYDTTFVAAVAGAEASFSLDGAGNIWTWGDDASGQLGNGIVAADVAAPEQITGGTRYVAIASGAESVVALDDAGSIWTWGSDDAGQVGNGAAVGDVSVPQQLATTAAFTAVAAGDSHMLALDSDGNIWAWGEDGSGQLGNGALAGNVTAPQQITTGTVFASVAAGGDLSLAIDEDGGLWAWGSDAYGQAGNGASSGDVESPQRIAAGTSFVRISAGAIHAAALDASGTVWAWGNDDNGQVGNGAASGNVPAPVSVTGPHYLAVSSGGYFSLALDANGNIWTWGNDSYEQAGNGAATGVVTSPAQVTWDVTYTAVAAGAGHSLAIDSRGDLWAWGWDSFGQVGDGGAFVDIPAPRRVSVDVAYSAIAASEFTSFALDGDGNIWSWGTTSTGQLGNGASFSQVTRPVNVSSGVVYTDIAAGRFHVLALDAAGNLWSWGSDNAGQLGNGAATGDVTSRQQITFGTVFTAVGAGAYSSYAIDAGGNLWSWGYDGEGQLGNGAPTGVIDAPAQVTTGTAFTAVAAGYSHCLALDEGGNVWTWGNDDNGQVGNGAGAANVEAPTQLTSGIAYRSVAAGLEHSLAVDSAGHVWAWGSNGDSQVGTGTPALTVVSPVHVTTAGSLVAIAGGERHSIAVSADGTMLTWGSDADEQLGNTPRRDDADTPTNIGGATSVVQVTFDGVAGAGIQRLTETRARVTPAHVAGTAPVTVTYLYDGLARPPLTLPAPFTYLAPPPPPGPTPPPGPGSNPPPATGPGATHGAPRSDGSDGSDASVGTGSALTPATPEQTLEPTAMPEPTLEPTATPSAHPEPSAPPEAGAVDPGDEASAAFGWWWAVVALVITLVIAAIAYARSRRAA